jgi:CRISPR-associated endonuclease/helicase Cas3
MRENLGFQVAFFTRMIFSCLVDADRTATEAFCNPERATARKRPRPSIDDLIPVLDAFLDQKQHDVASTLVNRARAAVLSECLAAASLPPGFFSLNVPTGGGKTYSSLAFALHHAHAHELRRVVVAIPFTSIIEQAADAFRSALGDLAEPGLVEHHSNIEPRKQTLQNALAMENWDAPLIVTTNVQLYESLFAAATSPCRKLHRLARSVILLDEAQTIPVELLEPTLAALRELVNHYGCTVVLCTATQPALQRRDEFKIGLENVRPIIREPSRLFATLKRVTVTRLSKLADDDLADRLASEAEVLCVVNSRPHAARLYDALVGRRGTDGCYHLSTYMCAQHRRQKLVAIRRRLAAGKPCRLVSTQLVEAGVDIDFPVVYRAPAGFDSIAQSAGRCNREGRLDHGDVYVFDTEVPPPPGSLRRAADAASELIEDYPDPLAPEAVEAYFRHYYWLQEHLWDRCEVLEALRDDLRQPQLLLKFRAAAARYRIVRDEQSQILVPFDDTACEVRDRLLRGEDMDFALRRTAQRYLVGVRDALLAALSGQGVLMPHDSGVFLLVNEGAYSSDKGLSPEAIGLDPGLLIV